jgi:hypothetical protein
MPSPIDSTPGSNSQISDARSSGEPWPRFEHWATRPRPRRSALRDDRQRRKATGYRDAFGRTCVTHGSAGTLCRLAASESMSQTGLLDSEEPWPVIAVSQPAWADAHMHDLVIEGALRAVRVLG